MKVAYIMSSANCRTILKDMIVPQLEAGNHGAEVAGIFFFFDNTYMLTENDEIGQRLQAIHEKTDMILLACDKCAIERQIDDKLVKGAAIGCFPVLYGALGSAGIDQVITL